jgi:hypothetical protein
MKMNRLKHRFGFLKPKCVCAGIILLLLGLALFWRLSSDGNGCAEGCYVDISSSSYGSRVL